MSFADCELAILRTRVDEIDQKKGKKMINSPDISKIIGIVEEFLKKDRVFLIIMLFVLTILIYIYSHYTFISKSAFLFVLMFYSQF